MIRGMYASTSSLLTLLRRQEALSHNLANVNTPGFKQEIILFEDAGKIPLTRQQGAQKGFLGGLSMGVNAGLVTIDFGQGPLDNTGRDLDLAIVGEGFFQVQTPQGLRLTRDGNIHRDADGFLCTSNGDYLLGENGPIEIGEGVFTIVEDGHIYLAGEEAPAGRIVLAQVNDLGALQAEGANLFNPDEANIEALPANQISIKQGFLEGANVDVSGSLVGMMMALRSYEATQRSLKLQDTALQQFLDASRTM